MQFVRNSANSIKRSKLRHFPNVTNVRQPRKLLFIARAFQLSECILRKMAFYFGLFWSSQPGSGVLRGQNTSRNIYIKSCRTFFWFCSFYWKTLFANDGTLFRCFCVFQLSNTLCLFHFLKLQLFLKGGCLASICYLCSRLPVRFYFMVKWMIFFIR